MKKITSTLILFALIALPVRAASYAVTNDFGIPVTVTYWTNNGSTYLLSLSTNLASGVSNTFTLSTNGNGGIAIQATNATALIFVPWTNLPVAGTYVSAIFATAMSIAAPPVETVPQSQTILRSYFVTGAVPTEENFWELIDSMFWYVSFMYTNAVATETFAQQAANIFQASGKFIVTNSYNGGPLSNNVILLSPNNISSVQTSVGNLANVTFSTPLPNTNFVVYLSSSLGGVSLYYGAGGNPSLTTNGFILSFTATNRNHAIGFYVQ